MAYFKRDGGNGRGSFSGGNRRPGFGGSDRDDRRGLHPATCANCGRSTEVPFKPIPGRAIYCKDCFGKVDGGERDRFPRKEFRSERPERSSFRQDGGNADLKRELETMNSKMDRLIKAVEAMAFPKREEAAKKPAPVDVGAAKEARSLKEIVDSAVEPKPKKKPAAKKKGKK